MLNPDPQVKVPPSLEVLNEAVRRDSDAAVRGIKIVGAAVLIFWGSVAIALYWWFS